MEREKPESEKADMYQKGTDRSSAVMRLENLIKSNNNQPIVIRSKDGEEAKLSKNSIQKLVSEDANEQPRSRDCGVSNQPKSVSCCTNTRLYSAALP